MYFIFFSLTPSFISVFFRLCVLSKPLFNFSEHPQFRIVRSSCGILVYAQHTISLNILYTVTFSLSAKSNNTSQNTRSKEILPKSTQFHLSRIHFLLFAVYALLSSSLFLYRFISMKSSILLFSIPL